MKFKNKSILVTGGGSGIGRATALLIAEEGGLVTVADNNHANAQETVSQIQREGGTAQSISADVTDEQQVAAMVRSCVETYGRLDGAANCAGYPQQSLPMHEVTLDQWRKCIDVNLTGAFLCMKYQVAAMLASGGGSIVTVGSTAAVRGFPLSSEYGAAKAGLLGLVRCAAVDYGRQNIRVNAVLPGGTDTPMLREKLDTVPGLTEILAQQHLVGRLARPEEMGFAIRWLLSDEASFVTGVMLNVDSGQTAG